MSNLKKKNWNFIFNLYNAFIVRRYPVHLTHFVTERCNCSCPHCFVETKKIRNELTLEQIENIALTSGNALRNVSLSGGEPFFRQDIFEIANIWYKNSTVKSIAICTNGSMPDRILDFVKKADNENLPVSFFFSYDFIGKKHSENRKIKDLHIKVAESYKIIKNYFPKINTTFNITISKENVDTAYETYCYMRDVLKIQNINCTLIRGKNADNLDGEIKNNIAAVYKKVCENLDRDFDNGTIKGFSDNSLTSILLNAKNRMLWKYVLKTFVEKKYISPCRAGQLFGVISSDGFVYPCELLNLTFGNLADVDYNFMKCYNSDKARVIRNNILGSKCFCTFECCWLLNIFSTPKYYCILISKIFQNLNRK